jgi:hypothetical protein
MPTRNDGVYSNPVRPQAPCAEDYMYMGTRDGLDMFKHIDTREYLP